MSGRGVEERWWSAGLPPEKFFSATPSRVLENAHVEEGIKVAVIIDLCAQKGNCSLLLLSYSFCSPFAVLVTFVVQC